MTFTSIFFCKEAIQEKEGTCWGLCKRSVRSRSGGDETYTSIQGRSFSLHCRSTTAGIVFCRSSTLFLPFPHQALQQTWTGGARWEEQDSGCLVWLQATLCRKFMKMSQSFEASLGIIYYALPAQHRQYNFIPLLLQSAWQFIFGWNIKSGICCSQIFQAFCWIHVFHWNQFCF